eukprot:CAMPEP_0177676960 /NCGR_PEP_ID=MMETSP0447-20121125/28107_1 /TAXON_ID=0 /ORGANISM="Stygamoeba regulata, Strain BSH-02190019" /LENGTH=83 /DNA_ID=CAMNT_0019185637 /DNA_START=13 /DNA_END=265 /DNA_ORIENTATION=-
MKDASRKLDITMEKGYDEHGRKKTSTEAVLHDEEGKERVTQAVCHDDEVYHDDEVEKKRVRHAVFHDEGRFTQVGYHDEEGGR